MMTTTNKDRTEPQPAPDTSEKFWLILREPGKVPQRKGAFPYSRMKETLREFFDARPSAFITVLTYGNGEPDVQDAPECLEMLDGRSAPTAAKHRASSAAAFAGQSSAPADAERLALAERIERHRVYLTKPNSMNLEQLDEGDRTLIVSSLRAVGWRGATCKELLQVPDSSAPHTDKDA